MQKIHFKTAILFLITFICSTHSLSAEEIPNLPKLKLDNDQTTVSGLSSGAFMAIQLQVAYSDYFKGVASFAGGIYGCAEGQINTATGQCMQNPNEIETQKYIDKTIELEKKKKISPLTNLKGKNIYIFSGTKDSVVRLESAFRLKEFFDYFESNVSLNTNLASEHGFPTLSEGQECDKKGEPWIQKCQFDGAGEALLNLYKDLKPPLENEIKKNLIKFSQREFLSLNNLMYEVGYIYIPNQCQKDSNTHCRLHIAFHGCVQGPEYAQDIFPKNSGYNRWAEANNIVILYPSAKTGGLNLNGCWDWYGYTGTNYLSKEAPQMKTIMKMISILTK